jgi:aminoglycoside phosphotransferase (APT) family kinase protein
MAMVPPANTREPREAHKLDEGRLGRWLAAHVPGASSEILVRQFKGGQSNPTYWVGSGDHAFALRKKPPGKLLPSAHAVEREYRIMRALAGTDVPVPDALGLCEDDSVIGTPFFVMRYVAANIYWDPTLPELASNERRSAVYREYVRALAALHMVDYAKVGLGDYGKVGQYVARQVDRWSKQYEASRTSDIAPMEKLMKWLPANIPAGDETTLIHGDWRLDNMMFDDAQKCVAVIDWELSTLGHPASDVAYAAMNYHLNMPPRGGLAGLDVKSLGIPTEDELVADYCARTGRDRIEGWSFFMAFGMFRLAAIAQGVYKRSLQGNASADDAGMYGGAVTVLSDLACSIARV